MLARGRVVAVTTLRIIGDRGVAFVLMRPCVGDVHIGHRDGDVSLRANSNYAIVVPSKTHMPLDTVDAWRVLQESLDLHFAQTRTALLAHSGEMEVISWIKRGCGYLMTIQLAFPVLWGGAGTESSSAPLGLRAQSPSVPPLGSCHPALRFYRLAYASEDLFEAFRASYMCLECLVGTWGQKLPNESELTWLIRVIVARTGQSFIGTQPVEDYLREIYKDGRLPLFHARSSGTYYHPGGPERSEVSRLYEKLMYILSLLMSHELGQGFVGGWSSTSQHVRDAQVKSMANFDGIQLGRGGSRVVLGTRCEMVSMPRRHGECWLRAVAVGKVGVSFDAIELKSAGRDWFSIDLSGVIDGQEVEELVLEMSPISSSIRAPKRLWPK